MADKIKVKKARAADPGLGFILDLTGYVPLQNLTVNVSINYNGQSYSSAVAINNPINDNTPVFVVPFGDTLYNAGQQLNVRISVSGTMANGQSLNLDPYTATIPGQAGTFNLDVIRSYLPPTAETTVTETAQPSILNAGETLISPNGRYVCHMEPDGTLNLYDSNRPETPAASINGPSDAQGFTSYFGLMQSDGNFCLYRGLFGANGPTYWSIQNYSTYQGCSLVLTNNGVLGLSTDPSGNTTPVFTVLQVSTP